MSGVVLENARVVHHDRVEARPIAFESGRVVGSAFGDATRIDLRDHLIYPGLINAHDHLQLNAIPPLRHDRPFRNSYEWIEAFKPHLRQADVIAATLVPSDTRHRHGALKNLLAGVTTVAHHDPWHAVFDEPEFPVGVLRGAGWSHSLRLGLSGSYGPPVRESFCATAPDRPWVIHLAEGIDDVAASELSELEGLGCLAPNTVLVHGVGLTRADVDRVIERDAAVVWCPASNIGMFGRTRDPRRLFDAGRLALGSDSRLTGSRDLLDELRVAAANSDLSSRELLRLVTEDASRVLRLPECGGLNEGQNADCVIVRDDGDPFDALLRTTRSSIRAVVRNGMPVVADPDYLGWFEQCGIAVVGIQLDGRPKLVARTLMLTDAAAMEAGLEQPVGLK